MLSFSFFFFLNWYFQALNVELIYFCAFPESEKTINEECTETKDHLNKAGIIDMGICMAEQHID